jgi:transposase-like protein
MSKDTSDSTNIGFSDIESFVRERAQAFIQSILEEEVEEFLGRRKSERRAFNFGGHTVGHRSPE